VGHADAIAGELNVLSTTNAGAIISFVGFGRSIFKVQFPISWFAGTDAVI
jgi:hypothetical protein